MTNRARKGKKTKDEPQLEFNGLHLEVFPDVYFPHEDSFLLAEAAEKHAFGKVLDLGCGSGIAGISAAKNGKAESVTFADISKQAIENAALNCKLNLIPSPIHFILTDLFSMLKNERFDTILFNPPYLPTSSEEKLRGELNLAFDGGKTGRKIIDRFLPEFGRHLEKGGVLLYLHSSLTNDGITSGFLKAHHFKTGKISSQRFFFEEIAALKITGP
ncbi:MAG: HemK2/MTQ2 family protein methyltransferase [Candidatus Micrarchaeota archaeon]